MAGTTSSGWRPGRSRRSGSRTSAAPPAPTALLFLLLRHARLLGHWDAGIRFLENRGLVESAVLRREPSFVHIQTGAATTVSGESKFKQLYEPTPEVTGDETTTLGEYVALPSVLAGAPETADLRELVAALHVLQDAPTARLERVFAEHVDCASYRLDAWKTGLAASRLAELRAGTDDRRASRHLPRRLRMARERPSEARADDARTARS